MAPTAIPKEVAVFKEEAPPDVTYTDGVRAALPAVTGGILGGHHRQRAAVLPPPPKPAERPSRIKRRQREGGDLDQQSRSPIYPPLARTAHIQGTVVLHAIIDKDGTVQELQVVSGPPAAGAVGHGRREAVALQADPAQRRSGRSRYDHDCMFTMGE